MKNRLLLFSLAAFSFQTAISQDTEATTEQAVENDPTSFNRWTIELGAGQAKGIRPYAPGYFYSNPTSSVPFDLNNYEIGVRYMISPTFGLKFDVGYNLLQNQDDSGSLPFEMENIRIGAQGVVNAVRLFNFEEQAGRFGLLFHGGIQAARMTPQLGVNEGVSEYNVGGMIGVTPQFRITKRIGVYVDFTMYANVRQHFNWDGSYADPSDNLSGSMYSTSIGLTYSFGRQGMHGDWAVIEDAKSEEMKALDERIGELETMMNDTDKDGVPDYLDAENNSLAGVAVDTKGRMIDTNRNGVADELEKYMDNRITAAAEQNNNNEVVKRLINEGYVSVFFDFNSSNPTPASTQNISFVLTYLKNNANASVDITGYADEVGSTEVNQALSAKRANKVRNILIKAGISGSRINIVPAGEDTSVDKDSPEARRLVRRALFTIK